MSSVFTGRIIETKPAKPREDISAPTDPDSPATPNFYYNLYTDIAGIEYPGVAFAVGDNVDLAKQADIFSAMNYMLDAVHKNTRLVLPPTGNERQGYIVSLLPGQVKSQLSVVLNAPGDTIIESDLNQDAINLVFYIYGLESPNYTGFGVGIIYTAGRRLIELARENDYFTVGQPVRDQNTVDQDVLVGETATFIPPTWQAPAPDVVQWTVNGILIPGADGNADLVVENVTLDMDGFIYRTRAGYTKPNSTVPDSWKHSFQGILTVT